MDPPNLRRNWMKSLRRPHHRCRSRRWCCCAEGQAELDEVGSRDVTITIRIAEQTMKAELVIGYRMLIGAIRDRGRRQLQRVKAIIQWSEVQHGNRLCRRALRQVQRVSHVAAGPANGKRVVCQRHNIVESDSQTIETRDLCNEPSLTCVPVTAGNGVEWPSITPPPKLVTHTSVGSFGLKNTRVGCRNGYEVTCVNVGLAA